MSASLVKVLEKSNWGMFWIRNRRKNTWTIVNNTPFAFPDLYSADGGPFRPVFFQPFKTIVLSGKKITFLLAFIFTTIVTEVD